MEQTSKNNNKLNGQLNKERQKRKYILYWYKVVLLVSYSAADRGPDSCHHMVSLSIATVGDGEKKRSCSSGVMPPIATGLFSSFINGMGAERGGGAAVRRTWQSNARILSM